MKQVQQYSGIYPEDIKNHYIQSKVQMNIPVKKDKNWIEIQEQRHLEEKVLTRKRMSADTEKFEL
jgi:hypothetical protein|tara:strand:+ start:1100 stop:1294 length:195 start_codon:yes stop_codon:yes gene_type:complete